MAYLAVAGDPVKDLFYDKNGKVKIQKAGGAWNTYFNLEAVCKNWLKNTSCVALNDSSQNRGSIVVDHIFPDQFYRNEFCTVHYDHEGNIFKKDNIEYRPVVNVVSAVRNNYLDEPAILILSDYNHGAIKANPFHTYCYDLELPWDMVVVDSRHRTIDTLYLKDDAFKVWHCTGTEFDKSYAELFNLILYTDGSNSAYLIDMTTNKLTEFKIPDTPIVNTAGAGDTFVAAWTAHYIKNNNIFDAMAFAINAAQDVIQTPYTDITRAKI